MQKQILWVVMIVIIALLLWIVLGDNPQDQPQTNNSGNGNQTQTQTPDNNTNTGSMTDDPAGDEPAAQDDNTLQGTLLVSNDASRGNYMLLLSDSDRLIYIRTNRDYDEFVDQEVDVEFSGDLSQFSLIDITLQN